MHVLAQADGHGCTNRLLGDGVLGVYTEPMAQPSPVPPPGFDELSVDEQLDYVQALCFQALDLGRFVLVYPSANPSFGAPATGTEGCFASGDVRGTEDESLVDAGVLAGCTAEAIGCPLSVTVLRLKQRPEVPWSDAHWRTGPPQSIPKERFQIALQGATGDIGHSSRSPRGRAARAPERRRPRS